MDDSKALPVWTVEGREAALRRKARKQIDGPAPAERDRGAGGAEFNLWYALSAVERGRSRGSALLVPC